MATTISATEAALLGLLAGRELSGYDLQREAEKSGGFFWAPTKSRIYAVLPQLVERGYATSRSVVQANRPNKQLYRATRAGRAARSRSARLAQRIIARAHSRPWRTVSSA